MPNTPEAKYKSGQQVTYQGIMFSIDDAYYKYPDKAIHPGWYYDLNHFDCKQIAESKLTPIGGLK